MKNFVLVIVFSMLVVFALAEKKKEEKTDLKDLEQSASVGWGWPQHGWGWGGHSYVHRVQGWGWGHHHHQPTHQGWGWGWPAVHVSHGWGWH